MSAEHAAIKRATTAAQKAMDRLDAETLGELTQLYRRAADDIKARIASFAGGDGGIALASLQDLLGQVNAQLQQLTTLRDALLNGATISAAQLGVQPLETALELDVRMRISNEAVAFVRNFIAADGLQLSDRIWRLDRHAREAVGGAIEQAVIQGHGAAQAAFELLGRGETIPLDVQAKMGAANAGRIGKAAAGALLTGEGSPLDNALRLFRTEINRAHGEAYIKAALEHPDAAGVRFLLSPAHPKPDICDLHSTANLYGLGPGVYPNREKCPWPAHPNTLSYVEVVFKDEITAEDRAGKETALQALERLTPAQRIGALGVNKHEIFKEGRLTSGMIKAPWRVVQARVDRNISRVNLFQWDETKRLDNIDRHGLDFVDVRLVFESATQTRLDRRTDYGENRWITYGRLYGRLVAVVHTQRAGETRIISFRKANRREQVAFENRP